MSGDCTPTGHELPKFPTDDFTLRHLEHALNTCRGDGNQLVGGEFTLSMFLDFMSGDDPDRSTLIGYSDDSIPIYESWDQHYTERCVIRALLAELRRLKRGVGDE